MWYFFYDKYDRNKFRMDVEIRKGMWIYCIFHCIFNHFVHWNLQWICNNAHSHETDGLMLKIAFWDSNAWHIETFLGKRKYL